MDKLTAIVGSLIDLDRTDSAYVSRPLLAFIELWVDLPPEEQASRLPELRDALQDGLDVDFTGTQWAAEWLANGKVCRCNACVTAREALEAIQIWEE